MRGRELLGAFVPLGLLVSCGDSPKSRLRPRGVKKPPPHAEIIEPTECLEMRAELRAQQFDRLEDRFGELQKRYEADPRIEEEVLNAHMCFWTSDPTLEEPLDLWVREQPDSWVAHTIRADYLNRNASLQRGARWSSETSRRQWQNYEDFQLGARYDAERALELNPRALSAYCTLIGLSIVPREDRERFYRQALETDPASVAIRRNYLFLLQPKWGGSMEAIEAVVEEAMEHLPDNPKLEVLRGYSSYVEADAARLFRDEPERALELYAEALSHGYSSWVMIDRAEVLNRLRRYHEAIEDLDRVLEYRPDNALALAQRGLSYASLRQTERGMKDLELAVELDPLNPTMRTNRGWARCLTKHFEEALEDYELALRYDPRNNWVLADRAYILNKLERYAESAESAARALEYGYEDGNLWYVRCTALYRLQDEDAMECFDAYRRQIRKPSGKREPARVAWIATILAADPATRFDHLDDMPR